MNDQHHPPLGVAVDRDVGLLPRYQLSPRLVDGRTLIFRDDFDPHGDWTPWAPAQAELDRLRAERDALRAALAGAVNVLDLLRTYGNAKYDYASSRAGTLVHVAPTIDAAAALLTPNAVFSGAGRE